MNEHSLDKILSVYFLIDSFTLVKKLEMYRTFDTVQRVFQCVHRTTANIECLEQCMNGKFFLKGNYDVKEEYNKELSYLKWLKEDYPEAFV